MKYFKECELCADENHSFNDVAEYCYQWSLSQGWFQLDGRDKLPGGPRIGNRDGSKSLKPRSKSSLFVERHLKEHDDTRLESCYVLIQQV